MEESSMATWAEVKRTIRQNFKVADESQDVLKLIFETNDDRTQIVFIEKTQNADGELWVQISSPIGIIDTSEIDDALEIVGETLCGGLIKENGTHYVRHSMLADDLSYDELIWPLNIVCETADMLEEKFIGSDEN